MQLPKGQKLLVISGLLIILLLLVNRWRDLNRLNRKVSQVFNLRQFTVTNSGLPNIPDAKSVSNITRAIKVFFEPLQQFLGATIVITSGYRSRAVNDYAGGVKNSKHLTGEGFDFKVSGFSGYWLRDQIYKAGLNKLLTFIQAHNTYVHIEF